MFEGVYSTLWYRAVFSIFILGFAIIVFFWYSCSWSQRMIVKCEREFIRVFDSAPRAS